MSKGCVILPFEYNLGGVVDLQCEAIIRFGKIQSVKVTFNDLIFDTEGIVIDWEGEFIPMSESIKYYAIEFYRETKQENIDIGSVIFVPEISE